MNRNEIDLLNKSIREGFICSHFMGTICLFQCERYKRNKFALNVQRYERICQERDEQDQTKLSLV